MCRPLRGLRIFSPASHRFRGGPNNPARVAGSVYRRGDFKRGMTVTFFVVDNVFDFVLLSACKRTGKPARLGGAPEKIFENLAINSEPEPANAEKTWPFWAG